MIARLASSCLCGSWVKPGMRIAYDGEMRRVTMCPACKPQSRKVKFGEMVAVNVDGLGRWHVQSAREGGKLVGFVISHQAADSMGAWALYQHKDGRYTCTRSSMNIDAPISFTDAHIRALVNAAIATKRAA